MKNLFSIILQANESGVYLWKEPNKADLSVVFDKDRGFPAAIKELIIESKSEIIELLFFNNVDSKEKAKGIVYYRTPDKYNEFILSNIQKGIYLQTQLDKENTTYNVPILLKISGDIKTAMMEEALRRLPIKQRILRLNVIDNFKYQLRDMVDMRTSSAKIYSSDINGYIKEQLYYQFNLENDQLIKLELVEIIDDKFYIINLTHHHILSDAYSVNVLVNEVLTTYRELLALVNKSQTVQSVNNVDYLDFISYQRSKIESEEYATQKNKLIQKLLAVAPIKLNQKNFHRLDNKGDNFIVSLDQNIYINLKQLSIDNRLSVYSILVTTLYYTLSVYNENNDRFAIGLTVSNRSSDFNNVVGPFISTLPLIFDFDDNDSILENIKKCQDELIYLNQYNLLNINQLAENQHELSSRILDLMHVMFTMHNFIDEANQIVPNISYEMIDVVEETEKFGLSITAKEIDSTIEFNISYASSLYCEEYIRQIFSGYICLLSRIVQEPLQVSQIKFRSDYLLEKAEYQKIVYDWNKTDKPYPEDKTIHQLFEEQVEITPDNIALIYQENQLTYRELNEKSNQLARHIRQEYKKRTNQELAPDTLITLCLDRSLEMIIGIMSVLKAGGAYVPIDPNYPRERLDYILKDTKSELILTQEHLLNKDENNDEYDYSTQNSTFSLPKDKILLIDLKQDFYKKGDMANLQPYSSSKDLAYVIYTSGTTGRPKGVMIEHKSFVQFIFNFNGYLLIEQKCLNRNILALTNYVFDIFGLEYALPLVCGGKIRLSTIENVTYEDIKDVNIVQQTPTILLQLLETRGNYFLDKLCLVGGESLSSAVAYRLQKSFTRLINVYGPTETTIWSIKHQVKFQNDIAIGRPLSNERVYVLNSKLQPLPIGAIGELYISGLGLARGYLNLPELTMEKFIFNPFATDEDMINGYTRLYKTGDLCRYFSDGNIEYIGRNDNQAKIRGYRIELSEIENALLSIAGIKQSVVLIKEKKLSIEEITTKYLVGYFVLDKESDLELETKKVKMGQLNNNSSKDEIIDSAEEQSPSNVNLLTQELILSKLAEFLPDYMIPNILIKLESLPLTINGKLDKKALPDPEFIDVNNYVAPNTELEVELCEIWREALELENVGIKDNFFRIGGNSILAFRLVNRINVRFNTQISVRDLFNFKTIAKLTENIKSSTGIFKYKDYLIVDGCNNENEPFELTNVQQAYLYGRSGDLELGNISSHLYFELLFNKIDINKFELSINRLIKRHAALRTIFQKDKQCILDKVDQYKVIYHGEVDSAKLNAVRARLSHKIYDVEKWPLFDFEISQCVDSYILHVSFDALIMDGTSMVVFFSELAHLYNSECVSKVILPELKINFRDYILNFNKIRQSDLYAEAKNYWLNKLEDYYFDTRLPMLVNPSNIKSPKFARLTKTIPIQKWQKIEEQAKYYNLSPTSVVLYVYGLVLTRWSGKSKFCINLTLFNRLPLHEQINDILGDFTVLELFNFIYDKKLNICDAIQIVHKELWDDIEHNLYDGIDFQRLVRKKLDISRNQSLSPVVLTSILGNKLTWRSLNGYIGQGYSTTQTSQVYLDNKAYKTDDRFVAEWDYVEELFDARIIMQMHEDYCSLIEHLAEVSWEENLPEIPLSDEDQAIIAAGNKDKQEEVLCTLFDICTSKIANQEDRIAVVDQIDAYSYATIDIYSYHIAGYLHDKKLSQINNLIGVLSEKGYQQVVSILGIMQSGSAYLPLNVDWPLGRIDEVLIEGLVSSILVSKNEFDFKIKYSEIENKYNWLIIEELINYDSSVARNELIKAKPDDIAYVIFTSGSTGKPKGVTISHRGAVNTIVAVNNRFNVNENDAVLALSELSFDLSVYDIFGVLASGGTIIFPEQTRTKEPAHWFELINKHKISIWNTAPQLMQLLADYANDTNQKLNTLKMVLISGDRIPLKLPQQIKALSPETKVMSLGGATEGSIWSIWYEVNDISIEWNSIPYGIAMPNQKMYVLNDFGESCPIDVIGEICIGGIGVALGYWNDKEKTDISFIHHDNLGRLYKTGDMGRWKRDGYIEFMGRQDKQVKINGYRVELGDIENKLLHVPGIRQAIATIATQKNQNYVVGYLLPDILDKVNYENFNKEEFKLSTLGIRDDAADGNKLDIEIDEKRYRLRKSYRVYNDKSLDKELINRVIQSAYIEMDVLLSNASSSTVTKKLELNSIAYLFKILSCCKLEDKVLPKYLYPSAGSTYAVRSYINITSLKSDAGYYYFNPLQITLNKVNHWKNYITEKGIERIDLVVYWPALKPLYHGESRRFAYIEAGHMLNLLLHQAKEMGLKVKIEVCEENLDVDNTLLARFILHPGDLAIISNETLKIVNPEKSNCNCENIMQWWQSKLNNIEKVLYMKQSSRLYKSDVGEINLDKQSIFIQSDEYSGQILENGNALITLTGKEDPHNLVYAGIYFQQLADMFYGYDYGSCMVGLKLSNTMLYAMVIGGIDKNAKLTAEIKTKKIPLKTYIERYIALELPDYMLPHSYVVVTHVPLTANGKVAFAQLPQAKMLESDKDYIAPRSELEQKLCTLYAEVLALPVNTISVTDDFFRLGGDSILCIQISSKLRQARFNCSIKDIFNFPSIDELAKHLQVQTTAIAENQFSAREDALGNYSGTETTQEQLCQLYDLERIVPATEMQKLMIKNFQQLNLSVYCLQSCYVLNDANINSDLIAEIENLINSATIFKSYFIQTANEGEIYQAIRKSLDFKINYVVNDDVGEAYISKYLQQDRVRSFNAFAATEILIRMSLFKVSDSKHILYIGMHHAIIDGWSNILLLNKIQEILFDKNYTKSVLGAEPFYKYCFLEKKIMQNSEYTDFWKDHLRDYVVNVIKPKNGFNEKGVSYTMRINKVGKKQIDSQIHELRIPVKIFFMFNFIKVLSEFFNYNDVCIGVVANTRSVAIEGSLDSLGMYWNLAPIRLNFAENDDQINNLDKTIRLVDREYGQYPLSKILRDQNAVNLFFATFKYIDFHHGALNMEGMVLYTAIDLYAYPINLTVAKDRDNDSYILRIDYMQNFLSENEIGKFIELFCEHLYNLEPNNILKSGNTMIEPKIKTVLC